ncbi:hypothetical protein BU23DRAFT_478675, partial [Bimuria novae-zelandiae CBS 107.79]
YIEVLQPLKEAIKRLKGRSDSSHFSIIYKIYSTFKYLLSYFEQLPDALENYLKINVTIAYLKLLKYYKLLKKTLVYYASIVLHPYYKYYFVNAWTREYKV